MFLSVKQGTACKGAWCAQGKAVLVLQLMDNQGRKGAWHHHRGNPHMNVRFLMHPSSTHPWPRPGQTPVDNPAACIASAPGIIFLWWKGSVVTTLLWMPQSPPMLPEMLCLPKTYIRSGVHSIESVVGGEGLAAVLCCCWFSPVLSNLNRK